MQPNFTPHQLLEEKWIPDAATLGGRSARKPRNYVAYVPEPIAEASWNLDSQLIENLSQAERSCSALSTSEGQVGLESAARQLLRSESVASSRIEGYKISNRRLSKALIPGVRDVNAQTVLGNVNAVTHAYEWARSGEPFTPETLRETHRILFAGTESERWGGVTRTSQNWIGGDASAPTNADFVPPPDAMVPELLSDLSVFCNRIDLPPVLQAAIAHAQFETIHPFMDGNGRAGRALIGMILIHRGVSGAVVPPVSLILAGRASRYVKGLTSYRYSDADDWFEFFANAVDDAAAAARELANSILDLQEDWYELAGSPRAGSSARAIIDALPTHPVLTLATTKDITGASDEANRRALNSLQDAGVLAETTAGKRNRVWESVGLFALLDQFERERSEPGRAPAETVGRE